MRNSVRKALVMLVTFAMLACNSQPAQEEAAQKEATYQGEFEPYKNHDIISVINNRIAKPTSCQSSNHSAEKWEEINLPAFDDYKKYFAQRVVLRSASDDTWGVLELDSNIIEAAFQIAVSEKRIDASQLPILRLKARKQLFKKNARTFVLMHNSPEFWALWYPEPALISQRNGSGRLVGMSVGIGLGMKRGDLAMLMFEDKVCEEDTSYAVKIEFTHASRVELLAAWGSQVVGQYVFGGESNLLGVLASVYQPYVPEQSQGQSLSFGNIYISPQNWLALASFALDLISFILKLI